MEPQLDLAIDCTYANPDMPIQQSYFNVYRQIYIKQGKIRLTVNGANYIIPAGHMFSFSNSDECSLEVLEAPYQRYLVTVQPPKIYHVLYDNPLMSIFQHRSAESFPTSDLIDYQEEAGTPFEGMSRESARFRPYRSDYMVSSLQQSLILTYRRSAGQSASYDGRHSFHIYEVKEYLEEYCLKDIQIKELVEQFHINVHYLSHSLKSTTRYSPKQLLSMNRLSYVKDLLWNTKKPIAQIVVECGFGNANNSIRAFKKYTGTAPGKFRFFTTSGNQL